MKSILLLLVGFFVCAAWPSACSVPIKNIEFCRIKGKFGAVCARWLDAKQSKRYVSLPEWNQKSLGMVCTSEEGMGNVNAIIEKLCQGRECVEKIQELITAIK